MSKLVVEQEDEDADQEELGLHGVYYTRVTGECKDNLRKISIAAEGVGHSSQEGASSKGTHDEQQGAVIVRARVARLIFHAYIVARRVTEVKRNQPKIVWPIRATTESASTAQKK